MTTKITYPKVNAALSVDYDFFCREDPMWDWGHQETPVFESGVAWWSRYRGLLLHKETSQLKHADVLPERFWDRISSVFDLKNIERILLADSHRHAYAFFEGATTQPDFVINIDAHHDFWPIERMPGVQAENWAAHLYDKWAHATKFVQVYPKWKDPALDGPTAPRTPVIERDLASFMKSMGSMRKLNGGKIRVRDLFICRSPSWVPPHLDKGLLKMIKQITDMNPLAEQGFAEPMFKRSAPNQRDAEREFREHAAMFKQLMEDSIKAAAEEREAKEKTDEATT